MMADLTLGVRSTIASDVQGSARSLAEGIRSRIGEVRVPITRKPGEVSWFDQVHAETRRRGDAEGEGT
jgi:hypothetical protein